MTVRSFATCNAISPGAARYLSTFPELLDESHGDLTPAALEIVARWNDGKFIRLPGRSDEQFLGELLDRLDAQLGELAGVKQVVAAVHHLPFRELLPPPRSAQWDFAKAYLGSERIGRLLLEFPNVKHALCGHSHFAARARVGHVEAIDIGSGYRSKNVVTLDL